MLLTLIELCLLDAESMSAAVQTGPRLAAYASGNIDRALVLALSLPNFDFLRYANKRDGPSAAFPTSPLSSPLFCSPGPAPAAGSLVIAYFSSSLSPCCLDHLLRNALASNVRGSLWIMWQLAEEAESLHSSEEVLDWRRAMGQERHVSALTVAPLSHLAHCSPSMATLMQSPLFGGG